MKFIIEILKGVLIGISNIIPGVSGGTMAVSMGIYDKIIHSITHIFSEFKKSIKFLFPYIIGMGIGIVGLSFLIEFLFGKFPLQTNLVFIGLIMGGLPVLVGKVKGSKVRVSYVIAFLAFFGLIIGLQLFGNQEGSEVALNVGVIDAVKLFFMGVIASATMVIPGVSGSMILMLLGYYNPIIESVNNFIRAVLRFDVPAIMQGVGILLPFGIGVVLGILVIAKMIEILLTKFEVLTYYGILGLVIASPFAILLNMGNVAINFSGIATGAIAFVFGFGVAYFLGRE